MKVKSQILFLLAVLSLTRAYSRSQRRACVPPAQGPPGVPPPVCRGPCECSTANCPGGLVTGVCGCSCAVCAKQEGDCCGGWRNYEGKCDVGLRCRPSPGPALPPGPGLPPPLGGFPPSIPGGIPNPEMNEE